MNTLAENILYIYLIVFISMLGFDIICILYRKMNDSKMKRLEIKVKNWIENEGESISNAHCKLLVRKLKRISYFIAFTHVIEQMNEKEQKKYLLQIKEVFFRIYSHYQSEEIIRLTYFVYFLSKYPYIYQEWDDNAITQFLIKCTTSPSVYLRENALNALYRTGKVSYIRESLHHMNYFNVAHHHKLLTDGLLKFTGDVDELTSMLISELESYNENYKVAAINYFSYKKVNCSKHILRILNDEKEPKEVRIACIRYFAAIPYNPAVSILYDFLKDDKKNWEYAAIASSTLKKYPKKETVKHLIKAIQSHNWYVRNNAAASLIDITEEDMLALIREKLDDKYAQEAIAYRLYLKGE